MGSGQFDKAAILSPDFSGVEAASSGFTVCLLPWLTASSLTAVDPPKRSFRPRLGLLR